LQFNEPWLLDVVMDPAKEIGQLLLVFLCTGFGKITEIQTGSEFTSICLLIGGARIYRILEIGDGMHKWNVAVD